MATHKKSGLPSRVPNSGILEPLNLDFMNEAVVAALRKGGWDGLVPKAIKDDAFDPTYMLDALLNMLSHPAAHDAEIFDEITATLLIQNEISFAVRFYRFEMKNEQRPGEFRNELVRFGKTLRAFLSKIPSSDSSDSSPIAVALKTAWTNSHCEVSCPICEDSIDPELYWDTRFGFKRLRSDLMLVQKIVDQVCADESGGGRDVVRPAHALVKSLAGIFEHFTGSKPTRNNDSGAFFDFVDAINEQMPANFQLKGIDHLIRSYLEQRRG
jgi:hypothetical protein